MGVFCLEHVWNITYHEENREIDGFWGLWRPARGLGVERKNSMIRNHHLFV